MADNATAGDTSGISSDGLYGPSPLVPMMAILAQRDALDRWLMLHLAKSLNLPPRIARNREPATLDSTQRQRQLGWDAP